MPTPLFAFRLDAVTAVKLREVSDIYGAQNPSVFCREMISSILGGHGPAVAFLVKLQQALTDQTFKEMAARQLAAQKPPAKRKVRKVDKKGRGD